MSVRRHRLAGGAILTAQDRWSYTTIMSVGYQYTTFTLDNLQVQPGDCERLAQRRRDWTAWTHSYGALAGDSSRTWRVATYLSGIEVTAEEARRLLAGGDPMAVLMPRMYARALTVAELMAR